MVWKRVGPGPAPAEARDAEETGRTSGGRGWGGGRSFFEFENCPNNVSSTSFNEEEKKAE